MKKANYLHIVLELVTIFSYIVIGVTIETFVGHDVELLNKSFIGSIILAIGVIQMVEYLSMKELAKLRNVPYIIVAVASMIFGIVILAVDMTLPLACVLWGSFAIGFQIIRIINSSINLQRQPFLNSFIIILCIIEIIERFIMCLT